MQPLYFKKFLLYEENSTKTNFLIFLESLNQTDWIDLIEGIITENKYIQLLRSDAKDLSVIDYFCAFFDQLNSHTVNLLKEALNFHFIKALPEIKNRSRSIAVKILEICSILEWGVNKDLIAQKLVLDPDLPESLRIKAANTLSVYEDGMDLNFWISDLNISKNPFFAFARIQALEFSNPKKSLETFRFLKEKPIDLSDYELPINSAVDKLLLEKNGKLFLKNLYNNIEEWAANFISNIVDNLEPAFPQVIELPDVSVNSFLGEDPQGIQLKLINTGIFDHESLNYAYKNGFFNFFNIEIDPIYDKNYTKYSKQYFSHSLANAITSLPRVIFEGNSSDNFSDLAIINSFKGYKLLYPKAGSIKPFNKEDPISSFEKLINYLLSKPQPQIFCLDKSAKNFIRIIWDFLHQENENLLEGRNFNTFIERNHQKLFQHMSSKNPQFIVATGPTLSYALDKGFELFLTIEDIQLYSLLRGKDFSYWENKFSSFNIHNVWNFNLKPLDWHSNESLIMRILSIAYQTIDRIKQDTLSFSRFVQDSWNSHNSIGLSIESIQRSIESSYDFKSFNEINDPNFREYRTSFKSNEIDPTELTKVIAPQVFQNFIIYRDKFLDSKKNIDLLLNHKKNKLTSNTINNLSRDIEIFNKHGNIYSFYDGQIVGNRIIEKLRAA
ncbi:hypothetical protein [uncultured Desulfosarcina sp.]|uniref:hypothetical protein n=1 Tax=uncultured Desulfosarcina sp. TaxID=218289 RepID=UPI0029C93150|nr:hypothetical protein [uncultured Desulfosarcina sp.]